MALAETARLIASLELDPRKFVSGAAKAEGSIGRMESKVGGLNSKFGGFAKNLKGGFSSALSTFSGRLKGIAAAGLGVLGIGGIFALGKGFSDAIAKAREFGDASIQLSRVTGQTIDAASRLVDALDFFGISGEKATKIAGMLTKNVGNLQVTGKAAKFMKDYGLKILDAKGHQLKFNDQLKESAAFFTNKSIPATQKAAALAKIYGRTWQDLIPILALGRKGVEAELARSMHISEADLDALTKNKQATREWTDAIGDLKTRIGIDLLPTITDLVRTLTGFVQSHGTEIRDFFKNAVTTGKQFGGAALDAIKGIKAVWDAIPDPVKDLLVKGIVADRTMKFLFGFSAIDLAKGALGGVASGLGNALVKAGIGKAFVQPVFVTNPGLGGVGGGAGSAAGAAAGGLGLVSKVFLVGEAIGLAALVFNVQQSISDASTKQAQGIHDVLKDSIAAPQSMADLKTKLAAIDTGIQEFKSNPFLLITAGDSLKELSAMHNDVVAAMDRLANANKSGSPDERQQRNDQARANVNKSGSPDDRQDASETQRKLTAIRDSSERNRIDAAAKLQAVASAMSSKAVSQITAQRAGDASIVSAIKNSQPITTVNVSASITTGSITRAQIVKATYSRGHVRGSPR